MSPAPIRLLLLLCALALAAPIAWAADGVAYHFDPAASQGPKGLRNIRNHLDVDPSARITVVTHAQGVDMLMEGTMHGMAAAQASAVAGAGPHQAPAPVAGPPRSGPSSLFEAGLQAHDRGAYVEAVALWQRAALAGHAGAAFNLGVLHEAGQGVGADLAAAARWYEMAALAGEPSAQLALGRLRELGQGLPRNLEEARFWYGRAAAAPPDGAEGEELRRQARERLQALPAPGPEHVAFEGGRFVFREAAGSTCLIALQGRVTRDASRTFTKVVERARSTGCADPVILLESPGGSLLDGIELGREVHHFRWTTAVRGSCASACSLIFLGGAKRQLFGARARIGFHQASRQDPQSMDKTCYTSRQDDASRRIRRYLEFVVPDHAEAIFERTMRTSCTAIDWVRGEEARTMGVATVLR